MAGSALGTEGECLDRAGKTLYDLAPAFAVFPHFTVIMVQFNELHLACSLLYVPIHVPGLLFLSSYGSTSC